MFRRPESHGRATFIVILFANLLPLAGILLLGWNVQIILFLYWIEIGLHVLVYSCLVLFAERGPNPDGRTIDPVTVSVPFVTNQSGTVQPIEWIPPIHRQNIKYAIGFLVWGLGFWGCISVLMVVIPSTETLEIPAGSTAVPVTEYISVISTVYSPDILLNALILAVSQLIAIRREFFIQCRLERMSAPMVVEIPTRKILFWFLVTGFAVFVFPIVSLPLVTVFDTTTVSQIGTATMVVIGKLVIEWGAFQAKHRAEPSGVFRWFVPEGFKSG